MPRMCDLGQLLACLITDIFDHPESSPLTLQVVLSDDEEEVSNNALAWFGYSENSNGAPSSTTNPSLSIEETMDEDQPWPDHSNKELQLSSEVL